MCAVRPGNKPVLIAGGGIAGLSAALALSAGGREVRVIERAGQFGELGAGLQISPNASRLLARLGVLEKLGAKAARPGAVRLMDARSGRLLAEMPLGKTAEARWRAPYLVAHRADLHGALAETAAARPNIAVEMGVSATGVRRDNGGVSVLTGGGGTIAADFVVGADGVRSGLRAAVRAAHESRFTGYVAWRALIGPDAVKRLPREASAMCVTALLNPRFHMVVYPAGGGECFNIVAVVKDGADGERWIADADRSALTAVLRNTCAAPLADAAVDWTAWPLHEVDCRPAWSDRKRLALIGDAAHAMTPFLAQGAAMAIEDGHVLARRICEHDDVLPSALRRFEASRKPRVARVVKRGAFNRLAWHASGPVARARDLVFRARSGAGLMRDLDWLYGFDADRPG